MQISLFTFKFYLYEKTSDCLVKKWHDRQDECAGYCCNESPGYLSEFKDCVVLQFGEDRYFTGATYCQNRNTGAFMIQSQAQFIVLMPLPLPFPLEETEEFMIKEIEA